MIYQIYRELRVHVFHDGTFGTKKEGGILLLKLYQVDYSYLEGEGGLLMFNIQMQYDDS
jgi:hypothetical protein